MEWNLGLGAHVPLVPRFCWCSTSKVIISNPASVVRHRQSEKLEVVNSFRGDVTTAKEKARNVTISSIPPVINPPDTEEKISSINAGLLQLCQEQEVSFADNTSMFTLGGGSLNDGYFEQDGHHITATAMNKLTRRLQVHLKDDAINTCDAVEQPKSSSSQNHRRPNYQTHAGQQQDIRCDYCPETGHVKDTCRHGRRVRCYSCNKYGHKSKFCSGR